MIMIAIKGGNNIMHTSTSVVHIANVYIILLPPFINTLIKAQNMYLCCLSMLILDNPKYILKININKDGRNLSPIQNYNFHIIPGRMEVNEASPNSSKTVKR